MDGRGAVCRSQDTSFPLLARACGEQKAISVTALRRDGQTVSQADSTHRLWPHLPDMGYLSNKAAIQIEKGKKDTAFKLT